MAVNPRPSLITAYWTDDGGDPGWNWRATYTDSRGEEAHQESGGFDGRQGIQLDLVVSRARRAAGAPRTRVPVQVFRFTHDQEPEHSP